MKQQIVLSSTSFRALVATFAPCGDWLDAETDPEERALYRARLAFIGEAHVTSSRAVMPMPSDVRDRERLAEDLRAWAEAPGLICEFETSRPNTQIRLAFSNVARKLEGGVR